MATEQKTQECRLLTPAELATMTRMFREMRHWPREQLADLSGLNVRTMQRVEQAMPASLDTRRAIARAVGLKDIDVFSKPFFLPSDEAGNAAKEKFEKEYITLAAHP
jgi:transcriptional regulator with XRE-family HTH domain